MNLKQAKIAIALGSAAAGLMVSTSHAAIVVSEVNPAGSSTVYGPSGYGADWFELTNTGPAAVTITGWKIDDSSNAFSTALALNGVSTIDAGKSVVFIEDTDNGKTKAPANAPDDASLISAFKAAWFGSNVPAGFTIGTYGGSGVGLSTSGDGINIFNAAGVHQAGVSFNGAVAGATFDNTAGLDGQTISTASVVGTNGAFTSATSGEIGSPGAVPEPASLALMGISGLTMLRRRRTV